MPIKTAESLMESLKTMDITSKHVLIIDDSEPSRKIIVKYNLLIIEH